IQSALTSTAPLPNGQWTHVAASYSGGTLSLYINGVLDGTLSGAVQPQNSSRPLSWGQESGARVYDGLLDEARAWHVARSGAELLGAMHQRLSGAQPGLVGYWRFDDGTGQAAHDASIHASDGILGQLPLPDVADPTWTTNAAPTP
ncbi:MAG: LamG domain-containing protein, partial [Gemmatimonadales bacterium]|nr:LamG domain-containing protein [Gemmatimonadales bacterium]